MDIAHGAHILVCDGAKALMFYNQGDMEYPNFQTVWEKVQDNPPTHEQGTDRPGRRSDTGFHKSAMSETDFHDEAEKSFARTLIDAVDADILSKNIHQLIVVAAPHMLGELRPLYSSHIQDHISAEVDKDLVHQDSRSIENILKAYQHK
ncbi:MAG: host attachment family protein [Sphingomonadales bacterium]|jgi:protein required for attachment to host cells